MGQKDTLARITGALDWYDASSAEGQLTRDNFHLFIIGLIGSISTSPVQTKTTLGVEIQMQIDPVTQDSHSNMVAALAKSGATIAAELTAGDCHAVHMAMGISGESGELLDAIKKSVIYRKPLDRANVVEELGDIEFYLEGLRQGLGITREETLLHNMDKLSVRYNGLKYSNEAAINREDKNPVEGCDQAPQEA